MKPIVLILQFLMVLAPFFAKVPKYLGYIYRFVKALATNPISWVVMAILPVVDLLASLFLGSGIGLSSIFTNLVNMFLDKLLSLTFDIDLQGMYEVLPATVLEISCYLGVAEALQIVFTGIVSALSVLLALKISLFLMFLKFKIFGAKITKL